MVQAVWNGPIVGPGLSARHTDARIVLAVMAALFACTSAGPAAGGVHPGRLAGEPWGECFAATLDYDGPEAGIRVPGTIRGSTRVYMDSLPPWLCALPLTDFTSRSAALTSLVRAGIALDRSLVEFEACFRSRRGDVVDGARPASPELQCVDEFDLPPRLLALTDSISLAELRFGDARREALARPDLPPAERALVESVHMVILTLGEVFDRYCPTRFDPDRRHRPRFVISHAGPTVVRVRLFGDDFMHGLWQVRWNLDSWLRPLAAP